MMKFRIETYIEMAEWSTFCENSTKKHGETGMARLIELIKVDNVRHEMQDKARDALSKDLPEASVPGCTCLTMQGKCRLHNPAT